MVRSGLTLFCVGIVITVSTSMLAVGLVGFLVAGMAHSLTGISLNTSIQVQIDDSYRGRAVTAYLMALLAGMPLGAFVGGVIADHTGLRPQCSRGTPPPPSRSSRTRSCATAGWRCSTRTSCDHARPPTHAPPKPWRPPAERR